MILGFWDDVHLALLQVAIWVQTQSLMCLICSHKETITCQITVVTAFDGRCHQTCLGRQLQPCQNLHKLDLFYQCGIQQKNNLPRSAQFHITRWPLASQLIATHLVHLDLWILQFWNPLNFWCGIQNAFFLCDAKSMRTNFKPSCVAKSNTL